MKKEHQGRPNRKGAESPPAGGRVTVQDIMSSDVVCCTPDTGVQEIATLMVEHDCGEVPVVEDHDSMTPLGVVTDRDIVCRVVAQGIDPADATARDCMSAPAVTVRMDADVQACSEVMSAHRIRRVPVVDGDGTCQGIVAQADLATKAPEPVAAKLVREVSQPTPHAPRS
jgi:CBS-domain-containing membrane protein